MSFEDNRNRSQVQFLPAQSAQVLPIPPNLMILDASLILTGTIAVTGGTTNGTVVGEGGPLNLLKRIRIIGNRANGSPFPGGYLLDASPRSLKRFAQFMQGGKFFVEQAGSTLGNGAAGTYGIYLEIPIFFADPNLHNEVQTGLYADPSAYESLQVQVQTGQLSDCFSGNDRTVTYNLQLQWKDRRIDIVPGTNAVELYQEDHDLMIGAANTRTPDLGLPQDGYFLSWQILAEQSTAFTLSDALLNRLRIEGPTYNYDLFANDIRATMYREMNLDAAANGAGLYFIDMTAGIIQNSNPANGLSVAYDVNNPSGTYQDKLKIFTRRVWPVQTGS
jgi:hypothetical protein